MEFANEGNSTGNPEYAWANVGHPSTSCTDVARTESVPQGLMSLRENDHHEIESRRDG
jgi:hypothetical protein